MKNFFEGYISPLTSDCSIYLFLLFFFICIFQETHAQNADSVDILEKMIEKDTSLVRKLSERFDQPIDSIIFRNNNTRFKKELYNLIFKSVSSGGKQSGNNNSLKSFEGKIIRNIKIINTEIFASTVTDTSYASDNLSEKLVGIVHHDTRDHVLRRYLLFKKGDRLDEFLTTENERILRELSFIMDARFIPQRIKSNNDSIDLLLYVQDKLPLGFEIDLVKSSLAVMGLSHQNMFGYGHEFTATSYWDAENRPHFGYGFLYGMPNLFGSFVRGTLEYVHKWDQETIKVNVSREFNIISFKNAGGVSLENSKVVRNIDLLDTVLYDINFKYTNVDIWSGRMLQQKYDPFGKYRSGLFIAGRFNKFENYENSQYNEDLMFTYQDKTLLLFSYGYTRQGFKKDNLIYTFGRTEDVPYGYLVALSSGVEWGQNKNRPYLSLMASYGTYMQNLSYLHGQFRIGTFFYNGLQEQGALRFQINYFTKLYNYHRYKYRNFVNFEYLHGISRYEGEFISIGNMGGINGLSGPSMRGIDKMVLNLESVLFSPYSLLGFRFSFFGGVDLGLIKYNEEKNYDYRLFSGVNLGVRIRNDRLVFDTFIIKFSVFPGMPKDAVARYFIIDNMQKNRFNDFFPHKPTTIEYR